MAGIYVDTSALGRVLLGEPDAGLIREALALYDPWWSSALVLVEPDGTSDQVSTKAGEVHTST